MPDRLFYVGGEFVEGTHNDEVPVTNPATRATLGHIPAATSEDINSAVVAAHAALTGEWARMDPRNRARLLRRLASELASASATLGVTETEDQGRILSETRTFGELAAEELEFYAGLVLSMRDARLPSNGDFTTVVRYEPVGVVAAITPWNSPLRLAVRKIGPALAAGNTIVLKPAPEAPLSTLKIGAMCESAGFPPGVINIVPGGAEAGEALITHPQVDAISFTGSTSVGRHIASVAGAELKRVNLEMGGKSPSIIFADCDLTTAIDTTISSLIANQGQVCTAPTRILVEDSIYDDALGMFVAGLEQVILGNPRSPDVNMGPLVSEFQLERVSRYVEGAESDGARILAGGKRAVLPEPLTGWFYLPTLIDNVEPHFPIVREEVFGPVAVVSRFESESNAVDIANGVDYGLSAAVWTENLRRAHRLVNDLDVGLVFVNTINAGVALGAPVAGRKISGFGVENGAEGVHALSNLKTVVEPR